MNGKHLAIGLVGALVLAGACADDGGSSRRRLDESAGAGGVATGEAGGGVADGGSAMSGAGEAALGESGATSTGGTEAGGGGGSTSAGGEGGNEKRACSEIELDYAAAFAAAIACDPLAAQDECTKVKSDSPGCGCPRSINPANTDAAAQLDGLTREYAAAGCDLNDCPEISSCATSGAITCDPGSNTCQAP